MLLQRLTVSGFKSFGETTDVVFDNGLTAIVGPNGSGKSNITDALAWAFGFLGNKGLRTDRQADLIFAGSKSAKRQSLGEVRVTLTNDRGLFPLDLPEITITRRVTGAGDVSTFLNGKPVSTEELRDLLTQAGITPGGSMIVRQGAIEHIARGDSDDLQQLLRHAAGITPLEARRQEALATIAKTSAGLTEILATIAALEPQHRILERDARNHELHNQRKKDFLEKARLFFGATIGNLHQQRRGLTRSISALRTKTEAHAKTRLALTKWQRNVSDAERTSAASDAKAQLASDRYEFFSRQTAQADKPKTNPTQRLTTKLRSLQRQEKAARIAIHNAAMVLHDLPTDLSSTTTAKLQHMATTVTATVQLLTRAATANRHDHLRSLANKTLSLTGSLANLARQQSKTTSATMHDLTTTLHAALEEYESANDELLDLQREIATLEAHIAQLRPAKKTTPAPKIDLAGLKKTMLAAQKEATAAKTTLQKLLDRKPAESDTDPIADLRVQETELAHLDQTLERATLTAKEFFSDREIASFRQATSDTSDLERAFLKAKRALETTPPGDPKTAATLKDIAQRLDQARSQRDELQRTQTSLTNLIAELSARMQRQFSRAFRMINESFATSFATLFGGGKAGLTSSTSRTPSLDSAIGLFAEPPIKRTHSIATLSGGEKSLTSLALLTACLRYQRVPLLILDEVDAALDEANTERFARFLKGLCTNAQCILITHNRQTMQHAHLLYGVTMGNDGISRVLSLRLKEAQTHGRN